MNILVPDSLWEPCGTKGDNYTRLICQITVNDLPMHLEAWQVIVEDDIQISPDDDDDENLAMMYEAFGPGERFRTTTIFGRDYVLFATPYCD